MVGHVALLNRDQLDVEHQHAARRARTRGRIAIGEVRRDPEARLLAFDHELHALGPSFDDVAERERRGFTARDRAVEHLAVGRPILRARPETAMEAQRSRMTTPLAVSENR